MPKQKRKETQEEQSARFRAEVERMVAAGELDPENADQMLDSIVRGRCSDEPKTEG